MPSGVTLGRAGTRSVLPNGADEVELDGMPVHGRFFNAEFFRRYGTVLGRPGRQVRGQHQAGQAQAAAVSPDRMQQHAESPAVRERGVLDKHVELALVVADQVNDLGGRHDEDAPDFAGVYLPLLRSVVLFSQEFRKIFQVPRFDGGQRGHRLRGSGLGNHRFECGRHLHHLAAARAAPGLHSQFIVHEQRTPAMGTLEGDWHVNLRADRTQGLLAPRRRSNRFLRRMRRPESVTRSSGKRRLSFLSGIIHLMQPNVKLLLGHVPEFPPGRHLTETAPAVTMWY